jgi:hypothetical protein
VQFVGIVQLIGPSTVTVKGRDTNVKTTAVKTPGSRPAKPKGTTATQGTEVRVFKVETSGLLNNRVNVATQLRSLKVGNHVAITYKISLGGDPVATNIIVTKAPRKPVAKK